MTNTLFSQVEKGGLKFLSPENKVHSDHKASAERSFVFRNVLITRKNLPEKFEISCVGTFMLMEILEAN